MSSKNREAAYLYDQSLMASGDVRRVDTALSRVRDQMEMRGRNAHLMADEAMGKEPFDSRLMGVRLRNQARTIERSLFLGCGTVVGIGLLGVAAYLISH